VVGRRIVAYIAEFGIVAALIFRGAHVRGAARGKCTHVRGAAITHGTRGASDTLVSARAAHGCVLNADWVFRSTACLIEIAGSSVYSIRAAVLAYWVSARKNGESPTAYVGGIAYYTCAMRERIWATDGFIGIVAGKLAVSELAGVLIVGAVAVVVLARHITV